MLTKIFYIFLSITLLVGCQSASKNEANEVNYPQKREIVQPITPAPTPIPAAPETKWTVVQPIVPTPTPQEIIMMPDTKKEVVPIPPTPTPAPKVVAPEPVAEKQPEKTTPKTLEKGYYTIRLIALPHEDYHHEKAIKLEKHLKSQNIDDVRLYESSSKQGQQYWVIDAGKFESSKSPEAVETLEKIKALEFEKKKQFKDAYFMQH